MARNIVSTAVLLAALVLATGLHAQGGPTTLQFSFSNPGARSLGLGGAFAALADDATAAFANPAGLTQLTRPEVSIEGRYWSYSTPFTEGGRVSGEATGIGLDGPIRIKESEFDTSALSFVSFVYPGRNWTVALSRHQSARFEATSATQGLFTDDRFDDPQPACLSGTNVCRYPDATHKTDISLVSTTASFAYRFTDAFSIGLGLSYFQGDLGLVQDLYVPSLESLPEGFFGPNAYPPEALFGSTVLDFDDTDRGVNFGLLWFPNRQWSLGGFFREGAKFSGSGAQIAGPAFDQSLIDDPVVGSESGIPLEIPNVYGLGLAYRSKQRSWTASFEWDRVLYSSILDSLDEGAIVDTNQVRLDDVSELRLGLEYAFLRRSPLLALRGGVWRNPDHAIRSLEFDDPLEQALLPGGEDDIHLALGLGVAFKNLQIDAAFDFSDLVDTASLSLIYRF